MSRAEKLRTFLESMELRYSPSQRYHEKASRALECICDTTKFSDEAFAGMLKEAEFFYQNQAKQQELSGLAHELVDQLQLEKDPEKRKQYVAGLLDTANKYLQGINHTLERVFTYAGRAKQKHMN